MCNLLLFLYMCNLDVLVWHVNLFIYILVREGNGENLVRENVVISLFPLFDDI